MNRLKTGLKVSLISGLVLISSVATSARADHQSHSILPYVAIGVFASILHNSGHSHTYRYKRKRHQGHYGHYGHSRHKKHYGYYRSHRKHSHSHGGYRYKHKRH